MRAVMFASLISVLALTTAFPQSTATQSTTINLANGETAQDLQAIVLTLSSIGGIQQASVDSAKTAIVVGGTADQLAFAKWLINELDKPAAGPLPVNSAAHEYKLPGSADDVVRVFYFAPSETQRGIQEVMSSIRSVVDIHRLMPYAARPALIVRGTAAQVAVAAWLVNELDQSANAQVSAPEGPHEYAIPGGGGEVVRVFYLPHTLTPQALQAIDVAVRSATNVRRLFPDFTHKALTMRGTPDQIATAERVINAHP
jgi:hypothetical protein